MFYVFIQDGKAVGADENYEGAREHGKIECRHDWRTFERAEQVAKELNENSTIWHRYLAVDSGAHVSPRYDVVERPVVGDAVSYSFNGDTYPDGTITKITGKNFRIVTTSTGSVYYRRKLSGSWVKKGGTWSMVKGHRNERNPSF